ncbi:MAG TPA: indolepyruvate ferredoxin oxidoreductase subunit alpha, partial [Anaerolineae bacterium]
MENLVQTKLLKKQETEVSFSREIKSLYLGEGDTFYGEGIMAVTKALLQSGVAYVGGYQGAPISHLLDVMVQSHELMTELGVKVTTCTNEAAAAALLGASINYPVRGAVTWKSVVGTNVAADALSNLASPGVIGGCLIILGEDYGEGASVIQERSLAFALKSTMWLLDPRPNLPTITHLVEKGFELSEASHAPVMLQLRIRACHVYGSFEAKDNQKPAWSALNRLETPRGMDYSKLAHPPVTFIQEKLKVSERLPAARQFVVEHQLNEFFEGKFEEVGIILQGGLYNTVINALEKAGYCDVFGNSDIPLYVLNVTHPLVPQQVEDFCRDKKTVLVVEEGNPAYIEDAIHVILRKARIDTNLMGKDVLPLAGEYTSTILLEGLAAFFQAAGLSATAAQTWVTKQQDTIEQVKQEIGEALPPRPPTFCTGCPERPVFSSLKLLQRDLKKNHIGPVHISADIGCHALASFAPFNSGNTILGYGMSLASASAVSSLNKTRPISIMGDGGFWHNGLITGVAGSVFNEDDSILIVMKNGYSSATGIQMIPSSLSQTAGAQTGGSIEAALRASGVERIETVKTYDMGRMLKTLHKMIASPLKGLQVIIAEGECQLARQRRLRAENQKKLKSGRRVVRSRFGVDDDTCTGDHSCIRLSGCPTLTIKPNPDPLRPDPVAYVNNDCVGCGACGEVAHA